MNRAVLTAVPLLVTSLTSMTPPRLLLTSTRRPARVAATSKVRVPSPESTTTSTQSPFIGSVRRQRGVDLADPGQDAAADVHRVGEPGVLDHRQRLGRARAALAVQHDPLVLRQPLQRRAGGELALRDQRGAGMETISYSFGSRTSTRKMSSPASSIAARSLALIVAPSAAAAASADTVPQNCS